jgi:hypothetical protein
MIGSPQKKATFEAWLCDGSAPEFLELPSKLINPTLFLRLQSTTSPYNRITPKAKPNNQSL